MGSEWDENWTVWEAVKVVVNWRGLAGRSTTLWVEEKLSGSDMSDTAGL